MRIIYGLIYGYVFGRQLENIILNKNRRKNHPVTILYKMNQVYQGRHYNFAKLIYFIRANVYGQQPVAYPYRDDFFYFRRATICNIIV